MKITLSIESMLDIINNSRNPKIAVQLFDGTYIAPELPKTAFIGKEKTIATFEGYDKWMDIVSYKIEISEEERTHPLDTGIRTMPYSSWIKASEGVEDASMILPKDIKIMEAMAAKQE